MRERQRWQPEEDALLRAYVKQYGAKEWNLISHRMGKSLDRDPKSCLERWKNYLKPGIKKGSLTLEEQTLVISLQAKYGNKWKKIASEVPGRTAKRLGKWWEVFKEKQLKLHKTTHLRHDPLRVPLLQRRRRRWRSSSPEHGKYDHILETFAEKYVQPKLLAFQPLPLRYMPNLSLSDPTPVLSLGFLGSLGISDAGVPVCPTMPSPVLPPWMNATTMGSMTSPISSSSSSSSMPSPSVSLSLSPSEPAVLDPIRLEALRMTPVQQAGNLTRYCQELEEERHNWIQHKKEATWRLTRLEQQLESEKSRKRREKMEEIEGKIRCLREEEMAHMGRIEIEYREKLLAIQRDAESKETKLMEAWCSKHVKLARLVEQLGIRSTPTQTCTLPTDLHKILNLKPLPLSSSPILYNK